MASAKVTVSSELFGALHDNSPGRMRLSSRVEELVRMESKNFEGLAWEIRRFYLANDGTLDAARRCLERAHGRVFPREPVPRMPKGFYRPDHSDRGDQLLATAPAGVLTDSTIGDMTVMGSYSSFRGYLRGELPTWARHRSTSHIGSVNL